MAGTIYETEYQRYLEEARTTLKNKPTEEYEKQQQLYHLIADIYDASTDKQESTDHIMLAEHVCKLFPDRRDISILDYGCGTGRVTDQLALRGFQNLHGLDPNASLLEKGKEKGHFKKIFQLNSTGDHSALPKNFYDVIVSSGTFFPSPTHPGYECFPILRE